MSDITTLHEFACYLRDWIGDRNPVPDEEYTRGYTQCLQDMLDKVEGMMGKRKFIYCPTCGKGTKIPGLHVCEGADK